jgi:hypothetical protein
LAHVKVRWRNKDGREYYTVIALKTLRRLRKRSPPRELIRWLQEIIHDLWEAHVMENP